MKKLYTSLAALGLAATLHGQVIMDVQQPGGLAGVYTVTWADPAGGWGMADPLDPANAVTDTLVIVDDGSASDSLGCNALINGADVAGQIAVVYRGSCEFGVKALNAQDAGAVGVVIINNQGAPIVPGAGAVGGQVTIPVVMISTNDGAALHDEIAAGNVVAFIGSIIGLYNNDVGYFNPDVVVPSHSAFPALCAQAAGEFEFPIGLWLNNYGSADQAGVVVTADLEQNGNNVFNSTSNPVDIVSGDSVFVDLGTVNLSSYSGFYELTYTATLNGVADDFTINNTKTMSILVDSLICYSPIDPGTELPLVSGSAVPNGNTDGFTLCSYFRDDNASRLGVTGLHFSITPTVLGTDITGTLVELGAFKITDVFSGISDFPDPPTLDPVNTTEYTLSGNTPSVNLWGAFSQSFALEDDQPYLFCVTTFSGDVRIGYNELLNYDEYRAVSDQPVSTVEDNTGFFNGGFTGGGAASIAVRTVSASAVGVQETSTNHAPAFPNPAVEELRIPLSGFSGAADLRIVDLNGKLVSQQRVNVGNTSLIVNVSDIAAGSYMFNLDLADGKSSTFRVMISK